MRFLLLVFLLSGCFQVQNSFENDANIYDEVPPLDLNDPAQLALSRARVVFKKYNCVTCHAENPSRFQGFETFSNEEWTSQSCGSSGPCITSNSANPSDSFFYNKLNTRNCAGGDCNMPSVSLTIDDADTQIIEDWINAI